MRYKIRPLAGIGALMVAAACSGNPQPKVAELPAPLKQPSDSLVEQARQEGVDAQRLQEAGKQALQTVSRLDQRTREEFLDLFGPDPLGLAQEPANAARYEIPLETNESVDHWIDYFQNQIPDRFSTYLARLGRYEPMIRSKLQAAGLPQDLLYLAMIESGMNPNAYSRAHAVGLWQFIRGTARLYGLDVSYWVDERRDPVKATDAAIAYLSDLYDEFGSWYLVAAAYNGGPGRIRRGMARTGLDSFWDLSDARVFRAETRNYVPKLIAAALIAHDPAAYGFADVDSEMPEGYDVVQVPDATSLDVVAKAAGVSEARIQQLNPEYLRNVTPPGRSADIRVPRGHRQEFAANFAKIPPSQRVTWLVHTVTRGQTLSEIASRYGTSVRAIRAANRGVNPRRLQIGQRLVVPRSGRPRSGRLASAGLDVPSAPRAVTVRRGDTLWAIARRYNVSTHDLMAWNNLSSSVIKPGDRIRLTR